MTSPLSYIISEYRNTSIRSWPHFQPLIFTFFYMSSANRLFCLVFTLELFPLLWEYVLVKMHNQRWDRWKFSLREVTVSFCSMKCLRLFSKYTWYGRMICVSVTKYGEWHYVHFPVTVTSFSAGAVRESSVTCPRRALWIYGPLSCRVILSGSCCGKTTNQRNVNSEREWWRSSVCLLLVCLLCFASLFAVLCLFAVYCVFVSFILCYCLPCPVSLFAVFCKSVCCVICLLFTVSLCCIVWIFGCCCHSCSQIHFLLLYFVYLCVCSWQEILHKNIHSWSRGNAKKKKNTWRRLPWCDSTVVMLLSPLFSYPFPIVAFCVLLCI